jgi:hypothetical protein
MSWDMTRWNPTVSFHVNITPLDDRSPNTPAGQFRSAQKTLGIPGLMGTHGADPNTLSPRRSGHTRRTTLSPKTRLFRPFLNDLSSQDAFYGPLFTSFASE